MLAQETGGDVTDQPLVPEWVTKAIRDIPTCPHCGLGVITRGRTEHFICALTAEEET